MKATRLVSMAGVFVFTASLSAQHVLVFPTVPHAANNFIPFGIGLTTAPVHECTQHQVVLSTLFSSVVAGSPVEIQKVAFAPGVNGTYYGDITVRLGYTSAIPGVGSVSGGLAVPAPGGGGAPNATGPMHLFFSNSNYSASFSGQLPTNFQMVLEGAPFTYDPAQGNLLVEIVSNADRLLGGVDLTVSRSAGSGEASRAYLSTRFASGESPITATRMEFTFVAGGGPVCYANCDGSTTAPILNVEDFTCFINEFAAATQLPHEQQLTHYANCDQSTTAPVLNVEDFTCFINQFAQGCP
jgi:hypothetical protein